MNILIKALVYFGAYHLVSTVILYSLIRIYSYDLWQTQYSKGGIEAVFTITQGNYHFGLFITLIFALGAVLKGLELKNTKGKIPLVRYITNGVLVSVVIISAIYFTLVNLLILFNPAYF